MSQNKRKRKLDTHGSLEIGETNPNDNKRKNSAKRVTAYHKSLSAEAKDRIKQKDTEQHGLQRESLSSESRNRI